MIVALTAPTGTTLRRHLHIRSSVRHYSEILLLWWLDTPLVRWQRQRTVQQAERQAAPLAAPLRARRATSPAVPLPTPVHPPQVQHDSPFFLPESALAHRWLDGLSGVEIGASAHNAFGLNSKNVGLTAEMDETDFVFFKETQIRTCGTWTPIDLPGYADAIPVEDSSQDFVLSSHVWEHLPNPLGALEEWVRVVRSGGYIFAIVPKRTAEPSDRGRPVTPLAVQIAHYQLHSSHEQRSREEGMIVRGHYSVFSVSSLLLIEAWWNATHASQLQRVAIQVTDDKAGNGHTIVWRVTKNKSQPLPLATPETINAASV
jgi:SAM-dependent methyltransferase